MGCSGSHAGGRCAFVEFVEYIWRPHEVRHRDETMSVSTRPDPIRRNYPGSGELDTWLRTNVVTITSQFVQTGYAFNVDGEPNYYESLAKIGRDFRRALGAAPKGLSAVQDLTARADLAVRTVEKLTVKDMDSFRVGNGPGKRGALSEILRDVYSDVEFDVVRKPSPESALYATGCDWTMIGQSQNTRQRTRISRQGWMQSSGHGEPGRLTQNTC